MSWLQIKKIIILKCRLLLFYAAMNHFSIWLCHVMTFQLWCVTKSGSYMIIGNKQLSGWTEKKLQSTFQSQTCIRKRSWSLFGGLLSICSTIVFWIPAKPLHLRSMLSKLIRCTKKCNAYSWHWWTEWAQFFSTTMPGHTSYNQYFKSWTNWATKFCFIYHIHMASRQPTTTSSSIPTTLCRENTSTTSRMQKMLSYHSSNPEAWIFLH